MTTSLCRTGLAACLVLTVSTTAAGKGKPVMVEQQLHVKATAKALCEGEVLVKLQPILQMERSIANKKLSQAGYEDWKKRRRARWLEARQVLDPVFERHGVALDALIATTQYFYDQDTQALERIRKLVVERVRKDCPEVHKKAGLDSSIEDTASVVLYGYR